jgi:hypothetical protein
MRMSVACLYAIALASCSAQVPAEPKDAPHPVLTMRVPKQIPDAALVQLQDIVNRAVSGCADIELQPRADDDDEIEMSVPPTALNLDSIAQTVFAACIDLHVARVSIVGESEGQRRMYRMLGTVDDAERLLQADAPLILWFHADWLGEGVALQKNILRDTEFFAAIGRTGLPLVRIDHTHPTNATNQLLSRFSANRIVPTVVVIAGGFQPPIVLEGVLAVQQLRESVSLIAPVHVPRH